MSCWYDVDFTIEGDDETIDLIYSALEKQCVSDNWGNDVLRNCGAICNYYKTEHNVLTFNTITYAVNASINEVLGLEKRFKNVHVYYEIKGCEDGPCSETNDTEGKYYKRFCCVDEYYEDILRMEGGSFSTLEEVFAYLKEKTNFVSSMEDVKKFNELYVGKGRILIIDKVTCKENEEITLESK